MFLETAWDRTGASADEAEPYSHKLVAMTVVKYARLLRVCPSHEHTRSIPVTRVPSDGIAINSFRCHPGLMLWMTTTSPRDDSIL